eukprot:CAMPEP_0168352904 /NCGR_PEP_ID=MMETSP0213-20121227/22876_1 /TAXON_ID=151035 /ORGANISM="Euplotes harpa, Strain FSP1.4" /LENGTH=76 /DNA_ID=CAMNT_0008364299 /DNA_START=265 /DNA_END=495 /DNA_ORIENTATION=-
MYLSVKKDVKESSEEVKNSSPHSEENKEETKVDNKDEDNDYNDNPEQRLLITKDLEHSVELDELEKKRLVTMFTNF